MEKIKLEAQKQVANGYVYARVDLPEDVRVTDALDKLFLSIVTKHAGAKPFQVVMGTRIREKLEAEMAELGLHGHPISVAFSPSLPPTAEDDAVPFEIHYNPTMPPATFAVRCKLPN